MHRDRTSVIPCQASVQAVTGDRFGYVPADHQTQIIFVHPKFTLCRFAEAPELSNGAPPKALKKILARNGVCRAKGIGRADTKVSMKAPDSM
jgi:hypothetical protein